MFEGQRGKAVHLLNAAMGEKKRKRPERNFELKTLTLNLKDATPGR